MVSAGRQQADDSCRTLTQAVGLLRQLSDSCESMIKDNTIDEIDARYTQKEPTIRSAGTESGSGTITSGVPVLYSRGYLADQKIAHTSWDGPREPRQLANNRHEHAHEAPPRQSTSSGK